MRKTPILALLLMLLLAGTAAADTAYPGNVSVSGNFVVGGTATLTG